MKKILLSLFGIITLGLINFSSAGSYTVNSTFYYKSASLITNSSNFIYFFVPSFGTYSSYVDISCVFSNLSSDLSSNSAVLDYSDWSLIKVQNVNGSISPSSVLSFSGSIRNGISYSNLYTSNFNPNSFYGYGLYYFAIRASSSISVSSNLVFTGLMSCTFSGDSVLISSSNTDCSSVESQLSSCQSDLATCQNNSSSSSCDSTSKISSLIDDNILYSGTDITASSSSYSNVFNYGNNGAGTYCIKFTSSSSKQLTMGFANGGTTTPSNLYTLYSDQYNNWICLYGNKPYLNIKPISDLTYSYEVYKLTDLYEGDICINETIGSDCTSCESDLTTCQNNLATCEGMYDRLESDYDLLSGNYNTCTSELNSCMSNSGSGTGTIQWSSLFINNIQHLGNENIYIDIPEEIKRTYTNTGTDFNLDVVGYNVDYEYMEEVINKQNYIPTTEDFSNVFSNLGLFGSLLVVCLFVILVFYMIKKIYS